MRQLLINCDCCRHKRKSITEGLVLLHASYQKRSNNAALITQPLSQSSLYKDKANCIISEWMAVSIGLHTMRSKTIESSFIPLHSSLCHPNAYLWRLSCFLCAWQKQKARLRSIFAEYFLSKKLRVSDKCEDKKNSKYKNTGHLEEVNTVKIAFVWEK